LAKATQNKIGLPTDLRAKTKYAVMLTQLDTRKGKKSSKRDGTIVKIVVGKQIKPEEGQTDEIDGHDKRG